MVYFPENHMNFPRQLIWWMQGLFRDNATVSRKKKMDIIIPHIPKIVLEILFDKNILNTIDIDFISREEMVSVIPFFMNILIFFI